MSYGIETFYFQTMDKETLNKHNLKWRSHNSYFIKGDKNYFVYHGDPANANIWGTGSAGSEAKWHLIENFNEFNSIKKDNTLDDIMFFYKFEVRKDKLGSFLDSV